MNKKVLIFMLVILILLIGAGVAYWYLLMGPNKASITVQPGQPSGNGFTPLNRQVSPNGQVNSASSTALNQTSQNQGNQSQSPVPVLRLLSATPIGGYGSEDIGATTTVSWIDRGTGNVYETNGGTLSITTLSNTIVPRMYESAWNKNLTAFIGSLLEDGDTEPTTVYAQLIAQSTSTATGPTSANSKTSSLGKSLASSTTSANQSLQTTNTSIASIAPFALRGSALPNNIIGYAVSPSQAQVFLMTDENGEGIGYVSNFNGTNIKEIFTTPLTQVNVAWPTANAIAITTKGSIDYEGYLYFVSPTTGVWKRILGPLPGLSDVVSHDGKYVLASASGDNQDVYTAIYNTQTGDITDAGIRTLADKCAWGNFYTDVVYCGVPETPVPGNYPDDWYSGVLSTVDDIWQVDASTGEIHLISSLTDQSGHLIDTFNLSLDDKDHYLFFMNKNDLSFWSLDLVQSQ